MSRLHVVLEIGAVISALVLLVDFGYRRAPVPTGHRIRKAAIKIGAMWAYAMLALIVLNAFEPAVWNGIVALIVVTTVCYLGVAIPVVKRKRHGPD
jgi:hypothetical protein